MADPTSNTTPDAFMRGNSNGYLADLAAIGAITNAKDMSEQLQRLSHQVCTGHADLSRAIDGSSFRTLEQFGIVGVNLQKVATDLEVNMEKLASDTNVLIAKGHGELTTQITLTSKDGIIDAAKNAAELRIQAERIASAQTLLAHQIAAAQAAKAAECCCEIKTKVVEEGCSTRALIAEIARRDADRREADLKTDLSNCKQTAEIARMIAERCGQQSHHGCCCPTFSLPVQVVPCSGGNGNGNGNN